MHGYVLDLMMNELTDEQIMDLNSGLQALGDKHFTIAVRLLSPLAELGHPEAQHRMAVMYQNGLGVTPSLEKAAQWMMKSAEQGYELALHGMGFMYLEGEGVERDPAKAVEWFKKGAEKGLIGSMTTLAEMYRQGNGVKQDLEEADRLLKMAGF